MARSMTRLWIAFWMVCTWKGTCGVDEEMEKAMYRLSFGSCNDQDEAQPLWKAVHEQGPDLFLFLGDNVYADRKVEGKWMAPTLKDLERCYDKQKRQPDYVKLIRNTPVRGMYDDHDGCLNDFGQGTCADLHERQKLMWDFFDEPEQSPKRKREGVYSSLEVGPKGKKVKIILLDTRSFRDPLVPGLEGSTGDVLGEEQWKWLEEELRESDANVHLIASSIQVVPYMHAYLEPLLQVESWNRFPKARERLFGLLRQLEVSGVIFLSGDVHYAEISQAPVGCALSYPLFDFTSSGMTHTALDESPLSIIFPSYAPDWVFPQPFKWPRFARKNFGSIDFFWNDEDPGESIVQMQAFGLEGPTKVFKRVRIKDLQAQPWTPRSDCPSEAHLPPTQRRRLLIVVFTSLMLHWILATALFILFMYKFRGHKLGSHVLSRLAGAKGYLFSMYYAKAEEKIH